MSNYSPQVFSMLPPAVKHLIIINVIVFLACMVLERYGGAMGGNIAAMLALWPIGHPQGITDFFSLAPSGTTLFRIWQPVTYLFMHGGFDHLFFNMFALWMFGYIMENYWGTRRFLLYYFVCGIGAALIHLLVVHGMHPTVGASGAIYGILLAFGMMFPNERIYLYFLVPIKAKWFVIGYAAIEFFEGFVNSYDGIAHFAHLGGMLFGLLLLLYWRRQERRGNWRDY